MIQHAEFLSQVRAYVEAHPDVAPHVSDFVAEGLRAALDEATQRACDMEVALSVAVGRNHKRHGELIRQKLDKWKGRTALNWDWLP